MPTSASTADGQINSSFCCGHSAGGLHIRAYASRFPDGVAGLVFVDASSPQQAHKLPPEVSVLDEHSPLEYTVLKSMFALGIVRLTG